jgi:hypothetical protein
VHPFAPIAAALLLAGPEAALDAGLAARAAGAGRAAWASGLLVGAPYRLSPLGEGGGPDADPRFRLDAFDCVTLVETAIALGNASRVEEAERLLDDVRYDGPADFTHRNHYVEAQWVPANLRKGWIADVTRELAGDRATVAAEKRLTPDGWKAAERSGHVLPDLPAASRPLGTFWLDVVPLDAVVALGPRIPEGAVLLVVRTDRPSRPYRVTHMGMVVVGPGGERLVRHASDVPGALRVRDEKLGAFVARLARQRGWPVVGVSLFAIRDNRGRAREILSAAPVPAAGP